MSTQSKTYISYTLDPQHGDFLPEYYDLLIKSASIVDGTGKSVFRGSIGIRGEKIAAVGDVKGDAARVIDGSGLVACPGFIDIHNHGDHILLQYPLAENYAMQGITTFVGGNCGGSQAPIKDYIRTPRGASDWWWELAPNTLGPPYFLSLSKYGKILEEKLGYAIDWRTFGEYLSKVEKQGISVNFISLVGHNAIRLAAMGMDFKRRSKPSEIEEMKGYVNEAMRSGAFGFSVNLDGIPGIGEYANTEEVIELAKVTQKYGGLYATHMRNCDNNYPGEPNEFGYGICHNITPDEMPVSKYYALLEALEVARKAKVSTQLSHLLPVYLVYTPHFPEYLQEAIAKATLDIIDEAREEGLDITFDIEPDGDMHDALCAASDLIGLFPKLFRKSGSKKRFIENLKIEAFREELKREWMNGKFKIMMIHPKTDPYWFNRIKILRCKNKEYEGKLIGEIAGKKNSDPMDTIFDLIIEDPETKFNCTNDRRWSDTMTRIFIQYPNCMIGMDICPLPSIKRKQDKKIWPGGRLTGTARGLGFYGFYPRYIRRIVKERKDISLEEAVKKATYLPAKKLKLKDRGIMKSGTYADVLVFDYKKIREKGTALNPRRAPEGIHQTIVNGKIVYEKMVHTGLKPGKVIRRK